MAFSALIVATVSLLAFSAKADTSCGRDTLRLTVRDLVTKVYGAIPANTDGKMLCDECQRCLSLTPAADGDALWLDAADGYALSYNGLSPEVCAMARFSNDTLTEYTYFFLFPYTSECKGDVNRNQAEFCGCLLQEMHDLGMNMGVNANAPEMLFDAFGGYEGNLVEVNLADEAGSDNSGRFIVTLMVEPSATAE